MLWIALISVLVLTLDAIVLWAFGLIKFALVVTIIAGLAWAAWVWRFRKRQTRLHEVDDGWLIDTGIELTNPDKPMKAKVAIEEDMLNKGFIVYGNPGSGKTKSLLMGYLHFLNQKHPDLGWLMADGKGNISLYQIMIGAGIEPDYLVSTTLDYSDTLNLIGFEAAHEVEEAACAILLNPEATGPSAFYASEEGQFLRRMVQVLVSVAQEENKKITFRDLKAFMADPDIANDILTKAAQLNRNPTAIEALYEWNCSEHRMRNLGGLKTRIEFFTDGPMADRWCDPEPTLNLPRAVERGEKIYLHMQISDLSRKVSIAITEMLRVVSNHRQAMGQDAAHALFPTIWEDWGGLMHDNWATIISRTREVNMPASFSFQSTSQTDEVGMTHDLDDSLLTTFVFNVKGVQTRQFCSNMFGQYETAKVSVSDKTGSSFDGTSTQRVLVPRVAPDDFGALAKGQCYIATAENGPNGTVNRRYYKVRFPHLPSVKNPSTVDWPVIEKPVGEGLGLWEKIEQAAAARNATRFTQTVDVEALHEEDAQTPAQPSANNAEPSQTPETSQAQTTNDAGGEAVVEQDVAPVETQLTEEDEAQAAALLAQVLPSDKKPKTKKSKPPKMSTKVETETL